MSSTTGVKRGRYSTCEVDGHGQAAQRSGGGGQELKAGDSVNTASEVMASRKAQAVQRLSDSKVFRSMHNVADGDEAFRKALQREVAKAKSTGANEVTVRTEKFRLLTEDEADDIGTD